MSKVQLVYVGMSQIVGGPELGLLLLSNLSQTRQIAIVCDHHMEYDLVYDQEKSLSQNDSCLKYFVISTH